jgi:hypothetical protein
MREKIYRNKTDDAHPLMATADQPWLSPALAGEAANAAIRLKIKMRAQNCALPMNDHLTDIRGSSCRPWKAMGPVFADQTEIVKRSGAKRGCLP